MAINGAQLTSNDINWPLFIAEWLESLEKTPKRLRRFIDENCKIEFGF